MSNAETVLRGWAQEEGLDPSSIRFEGYADLGRYTLGRCRYMPVGSPYRCGIGMATFWAIERKGWLWRSVLWHEFCHAWAYLEDDSPNGHDAHWRELRGKRKAYVVGDLVATLLGPRAR